MAIYRQGHRIPSNSGQPPESELSWLDSDQVELDREVFVLIRIVLLLINVTIDLIDTRFGRSLLVAITIFKKSALINRNFHLITNFVDSSTMFTSINVNSPSSISINRTDRTNRLQLVVN